MYDIEVSVREGDLMVARPYGADPESVRREWQERRNQIREFEWRHKRSVILSRHALSPSD